MASNPNGYGAASPPFHEQHYQQQPPPPQQPSYYTYDPAAAPPPQQQPQYMQPQPGGNPYAQQPPMAAPYAAQPLLPNNNGGPYQQQPPPPQYGAMPPPPSAAGDQQQQYYGGGGAPPAVGVPVPPQQPATDANPANEKPAGLSRREGMDVVAKKRGRLPGVMGILMIAFIAAGAIATVVSYRFKLLRMHGYAIGAVCVAIGFLVMSIVWKETWLEFDTAARVVRLRSKRIIQRLPCLGPSTEAEIPMDELGSVRPGDACQVEDSTRKGPHKPRFTYPLLLDLSASPGGGGGGGGGQTTTCFKITDLPEDTTQQRLRGQITAWRRFLNRMRPAPPGEPEVCDRADWMRLSQGVDLSPLVDDGH